MIAEDRQDDAITIVGGRPLERQVDVTLLPQGVEQVLTLAALDHDFRQKVALDPGAAAQSRGIRLDPIEARLLRSIKPGNLAQISEQLVIPRPGNLRAFSKGVSASVIAMVTGAAILCSGGCAAGSSPVAPPPHTNPDSTQKWMSLGGHTCYVYLPGVTVANPTTPRPVLVALHDQGETCLSNVQRWYRVADASGFNLISVNWTEEAPTPESQEQLATDLARILQDFNLSYKVDLTQRFLCSRGASTPIAWDAGFQNPHENLWKGVLFLGGVPPGDWKTNADALLTDLRVNPPAINLVSGKTDHEHEQAVALAAALASRGVTRKLTDVEGSLSQTTLDFFGLWNWLKNPTQ